MALSERTKRMLLAPFAISPIMQRFSLPGLAGILILAVGIWLDLDWMMVIGIILAAPIIWVYAVLIFGYLPLLIFDGIRRSLTRRK